MNKSKLIKLAKLVMKFTETQIGEMTWIHEGELAEGVEVMYENAEGEIVAVETGEYEADGKKYTVEEGKIISIEEVVEEPKEELEPVVEEPKEEPAKEEFSRKMKFYDASYNEIMGKIAQLVGKYAYVIDATGDSAIVSVYSEEDGSEHFYRYAYTVGEDGEVVLGESVEVYPKFITKEEEEKLQFAEEEPVADEKDAKIAELEAMVAERDAKIEELSVKVAELEAKVDAPVEEPVKMSAVASPRKSAVENKALRYFE